MRFAGSKNKKSIIPSSWFIRELKCKTFKLARMNILPTEMYPGFQIWGSSEPLFENSGGPLQHREIDGGNGLNKAIRQDQDQEGDHQDQLFVRVNHVSSAIFFWVNVALSNSYINLCTWIIEINKNRLFFLLILCFGIHSSDLLVNETLYMQAHFQCFGVFIKTKLKVCNVCLFSSLNNQFCTRWGWCQTLKSTSCWKWRVRRGKLR